MSAHGFLCQQRACAGAEHKWDAGKKPKDEMNLAPVPLLPLNKVETLTSLSTSPRPDPTRCLQLFGKDQTHRFTSNIPLRPTGKKDSLRK